MLLTLNLLTKIICLIIVTMSESNKIGPKTRISKFKRWWRSTILHHNKMVPTFIQYLFKILSQNRMCSEEIIQHNTMKRTVFLQHSKIEKIVASQIKFSDFQKPPTSGQTSYRGNLFVFCKRIQDYIHTTSSGLLSDHFFEADVSRISYVTIKKWWIQMR